MDMQERINAYWSLRAEEFSHYRLLDLAGPPRLAWSVFIRKNLPQKDGVIHALDTGTGAGFYAFLLAELGCETTGIDYSQDMVDQANANAAVLHYPPVTFLQMDAQNMSFPDGSFDFIISRNVTWTVPHPEQVYAEWYRLLSPGGVLVNIVANYGSMFKWADESGWTEKQNVKWNDSMALYTRPDMVRERNDISKQLSIASQIRPQWDLDRMLRLGFSEVSAIRNAMANILPDTASHHAGTAHTVPPEVGAPDTRIFMVRGVK